MKIFFPYLIFIGAVLSISGCNTGPLPDDNVEFIVEAKFSPVSNFSISTTILGSVDIDRVFFALNDSVFSPDLRNPTAQVIEGSGYSLLLRSDEIFEEILISYNGDTDIFYSPITECFPLEHYNVVVDTTRNSIGWQTCKETVTDYTIVTLNAEERCFSEDKTILKDTSFIVFSDSLILPNRYIPGYDDNRTFDRITDIKLTNVKGPLPGEKRNVKRTHFPITFFISSESYGTLYVR